MVQRKKSEVFTWRGKEYAQYSDIIEAALKLEGKEQKAFVKAYCATGPYARQNIGYFSGYYDREYAQKIMKVFETAHPIFGTSKPTVKEALEAGKQLGKQTKKKR